MNALVIGDVSVDTIAKLNDPIDTQSTHFPEAVYTRLGGSAAGKALNLDYFSHSVDLISRIGTDTHGAFVRDAFSRTQVHTHFIETSDATMTHFNLLSKHQERISIFTAHPDIHPKPNIQAYTSLIAASDIVFLELSGTFQHWAKHLNHPNVWVDLHDYDGKNPFMDPYIQVANIIMMSDVSLSLEASHKVGHSLSKSKAGVLITRGSQGVSLYQNGQRMDFPVINRLDPVDSDGAGDAFLVACAHYGHEDFETTIPHAMHHAEKAIMTRALAPQKNPPLTKR